MKIAFLHFDFCGGPQSRNTEKILQGMEVAAAKGAGWVLTPEMALQGYFMVRTGKPYSLASTTNGIYEPFMMAAKKLEVRLFLGCGQQECGEPPRNSDVVIAQDGTIAALHNKVKVVKWITEGWATGGDGFTVHNLDGIQTGLLVCADTWFGEHGKILSDKGAELIVSIAAWPDGDHGGPPQEAWKRCSRCAGGLPLLLCNQTGNSGMDCTAAESAIVQDGQIICTYSGDEAILFIEYDEKDKKILSKEFEIIKLRDLWLKE